jgi:TRAP-type C4-dicarboxylate transport system permease small subunit
MVTKILYSLETVLKFVCGGLLAVIVSALFYAVIMRYVLHQPPAWTMELSRYLFIWMVIFSAAIITREQSHIQILFVLDRLPRMPRFILSNFLRLLMIGFCWVMIRQGIFILPMVSEASSPTLGVSMGWLYLSIPVGGVLMGLYLLEAIVASISDYVKVDSRKEQSVC